MYSNAKQYFSPNLTQKGAKRSLELMYISTNLFTGVTGLCWALYSVDLETGLSCTGSQHFQTSGVTLEHTQGRQIVNNKICLVYFSIFCCIELDSD